MNDEKPDSNKCGDCFYCYKLYGCIWCVKYKTRTSPYADACSFSVNHHVDNHARKTHPVTRKDLYFQGGN